MTPGPARTFDWGRALSLREDGWSYQEIANELGVSNTAAWKAVQALGGAHLASDWRARLYPKGRPIAKRWPTRTLEERLREKIVIAPNGCWLWQGTTNHGYGWCGDEHGVSRNAHRLAWEIWVGPIPAGMTLDHVCHTNDPFCFGGECLHRRCLNPEHLEVVTRAENIRRGRQRLFNAIAQAAA